MSFDEWRETTLGKEVDLLTGFPFSSAKYTSSPAAPRLLRGDNVVQGQLRWDDAKRWPADEIAGLAEYFLQKDDIVLAMDRPWIEAGLKWAVMQEDDLPALLVQRVARLRTKGHADQVFLRYIIGSREFTEYVLGIQTGTSVPHISGPQIRDYIFECPPPLEQRAIARILRALDYKIELNRRMNRTLAAMAAALFKSWFVDFDPVVAKAEGRQPYGIDAETVGLFPSTFNDSELGNVPSGWAIGSLKDVADINPRSIDAEYPHRSIEYIDISSVTEGHLLDTKPLLYEDAPSRAQRLVAHGDTIWSCVRPNRKSYLYVQKPGPKVVVSTGFAVLTPRIVSSSYIYLWVTTDGFVEYLTAHAEGSAYPAVRPDTFAQAKTLIPPTNILARFERRVAPLFARLHNNELENCTLAAIRDALLPKLLSGEIRIRAAEHDVEQAIAG